jgi:hypothetical protein
MADERMHLIPVVLDLEAARDELRTTTALWPYSRSAEDRLAEFVNDQVWSRIKHNGSRSFPRSLTTRTHTTSSA